jgi:hypothetical protein
MPYRLYRVATLEEVIQDVQLHTSRIIELHRDVAPIRIAAVTFWYPYGSKEAEDFVTRALPRDLPVTVEVTPHTLRVHCFRESGCRALQLNPERFP